MAKTESLESELNLLLDTFLAKEKNRFPDNETLTIDLHCHDHNSDEPDELLGRILNVPETWLPTDDLLSTLKVHGCNTCTITNHNNARSCFELKDRGIDVLTGAEFSCLVPDYKTGIHVLTYGFTAAQEKMLNKLRYDLYKFQEYTREHDIPTIWAHPLYHYKSDGMPPMEFFEKMSLMFERFEVINGQRDTWQNMLVKEWIECLDEEKLSGYEKKFGIRGDRYCSHRFDKAMSGGSDSHMGVFTGLTGTKLHVPDLQMQLSRTNSVLALEAIKNLRMSPYGSKNDSEKMTVTFIDFLCQIAINMKDPGLIRMLLHKGDAKQKLLAFGLANMFFELKRHKVTMSFLQLFHECFTGKVPGYTKRFFIPKHYKKIFDEAIRLAEVRRDHPEKLVETTKSVIDNIYESLIKLFISRITAKVEKIFSNGGIKEFNINKIVESLEVPVSIRSYIDAIQTKKKKRGDIDLGEFLDGLSFPFLASSVILVAAYASARVMYNSRPLLREFSSQLGKMKHPERILWLTDTFEDINGVAMVLNSMLDEIRKRGLPIDILVCSSKLKSADNLIVVEPLTEFTFPFYEHQPMRIPNILDIHKLFKENEYSRIICSTEGPMGLISLFLKKAYSVPAYFFVHTDWMMFARQVLNFDHHNRSRLRRILRAYYRGFDGLFVLNTDQRRDLRKDQGPFPESQDRLCRKMSERCAAEKGYSRRDFPRMG